MRIADCGLRISRTLYDEVIAHCRRQYPKEACGVLAESTQPPAGQGADVVAVYPMTNVEDSPIGYSMDPKEQLTVEKLMRHRGQRMIGIYRSHTASAAYPSPVDVRLAAYPDVSYVLVSLKHQEHPDIKSYRIDGVTITPEETVVEG
ncbi:MAG: M67 family metallopeptidase [Candidatus Omnitrophica bacterium]|nr:M67 family metallopeptidase [Candidatus Omnitrophota bacterium]